MSVEFDEEKYCLVFVKPIGKNSIDWYEYDFYFSDKPDIVWGYDWDCEFADQGEIEPPDPQFNCVIKRLKSIIPLQCIQNNNCYGMRHAIEGIVSMAFEDISEYDEYPQGRIVFHFGEKYISVENKLSKRNQLFSEKN